MTELKAIPPSEPEATPVAELVAVEEPEPIVEVTETAEAVVPVVEVSESVDQPAALVVVTDIAEVSWLLDCGHASVLTAL